MAPPLCSGILSCCCRNRNGVFAVHGTSDRILNVPATFSPRGVVSLVIKLLLLCLSITSVTFSVIDNRGSLFFLAYLTNWGLILTMMYSMMSFTNSIVKLKQPPALSGSTDFVGYRAAATWLLFDIAAHTQLMVGFLYWALVHKPQWGYRFATIIEHCGLLLLLLVEGQTMNRIPIRWNHFPFVFMFHLIYLIWTLIHGFYEISCPDQPPTRADDEDSITDVVDWTGNPKSTFSLVAAIQLGIVPMLYGILWLISLPCRRYKPTKQTQTKFKTGDTGKGFTEPQPNSVYTRISDDECSTILSSDTIIAAKKIDDRLRIVAEV